MSTEAFEDFYFRVCTLDYARMARGDGAAARSAWRRTDRVRIKGPGTDLRFSIKGIGVVPCEGRRNLPDGECFTAPVRDSVKGMITLQHAVALPRHHLRPARASRSRAAGSSSADGRSAGRSSNALLDTDEGARYIGEFSLGFNPYILQPMKDTLFDEKIAGSLHFTPGPGLRRSPTTATAREIHWDLVLIQRPEYGGGEVWFDDELIRQDGRFVAPELEGLNPENLGDAATSLAAR